MAKDRRDPGMKAQGSAIRWRKQIAEAAIFADLLVIAVVLPERETKAAMTGIPARHEGRWMRKDKPRLTLDLEALRKFSQIVQREAEQEPRLHRVAIQPCPMRQMVEQSGAGAHQRQTRRGHIEAMIGQGMPFGARVGMRPGFAPITRDKIFDQSHETPEFPRATIAQRYQRSHSYAQKVAGQSGSPANRTLGHGSPKIADGAPQKSDRSDVGTAPPNHGS